MRHPLPECSRGERGVSTGFLRSLSTSSIRKRQFETAVQKGIQFIMSDSDDKTTTDDGSSKEPVNSEETENPLLEAAESMLDAQKEDRIEDTDSDDRVESNDQGPNNRGDAIDHGREEKRQGSGSPVEDPPQKSSSKTGSRQSSSNTKSGSNNESSAFPELQWDSEIEPTKIEWLWDGYIAHGMLHMLNGDPGTGKSTLLLTLAAQFSKKKAPDGGMLDEAVDTLYLSAEDQANVTLVPRYRAAAGRKGHLLPIGAANAVDIAFPEQREELQTIIEAQNIQFCVIDPLFAFLSPGFQKNSEQDIREVLSGITEVADETGCAFVLVRHFNKKEDLSAVYRGGGSIGITAQARLGFALAPHPDRPEQAKVLAWTKNNLSDKSLQEALVFKDKTMPVPGASDQPTLEYEGKETWTADQLLSSGQKQQGRPPDKLRKAKQFLQDELEDGRTPSTVLLDSAEEKDFSKTTLRRAKTALGVEANQDGDQWWWHFPDDGSSDEHSERNGFSNNGD